MKYKNYYKILGLPNAKVTDEEIKSAYRHLAKKYHPDLNGGSSEIADKFKDINEAYQVLGDLNSRKKYDRVHFAYKFRDGFVASNAKDKVNTETGVNDFLSILFGKNNKQTVVTNLDKYTNSKNKEVGGNLRSTMDITLEEAFYGSERKIAFKTIDNKIKTLVVKIPRGIRKHQSIRLAEQGKPGKNGGKNGDFYININILPHDYLEIDGYDLVTNLYITPWEAAFGFETEITGIDKTVKLNVPAGVQTDKKFRIAKAGFIDDLGNRGDLMVVVKIMMPEKLSDEEKELFLKFKEISTYNPRKN